LKANWKKTAIA